MRLADKIKSTVKAEYPDINANIYYRVESWCDMLRQFSTPSVVPRPRIQEINLQQRV